MRLLHAMGFALATSGRLVMAVLIQDRRPRAPWRWLSAGRALVGPAFAALSVEERPLDAFRWADWTVKHADRAGGMGSQSAIAVRVGVRALVQLDEVHHAIDWALPRFDDRAKGWLLLVETVRRLRGPQAVPGLVARARMELPADDTGAAASLMALAVEAHEARVKRDAADSWRAEILDLARDARDWSADAVGRVARVFSGESRVQALLERVFATSELPDSASWYRVVQGMLANDMLDHAVEAVIRSTPAVLDTPDDPAGWLAALHVGQALLDAGRLDEAETLASLAVDRAIRAEQGLGLEATEILHGRTLHALGRHEEAREALERGTSIDASAEAAWLSDSLGVVYPDPPPPRLVVQAAGWYTLGRVLERQGQRGEAAYEKARRLAVKHALLKGGTAADWILDSLDTGAMSR